MAILKLNQVNAYYGSKQILKNISLDIKEKSITAIVGPSGCGKSTLLLTLNRMLQEHKGKTEGELLFKGRCLYSYPIEEIRKNIGIVFQAASPFPLSIYKNLTYAPLYHGVKDKAKLKEIAINKLQATGLYEEVKDQLKESALKLSGGQQQRLCIARTLTVEPEVLLLDEPCSALDIKNTAIIEELLVELAKKYTILIVTHNLAQAKRIAGYTAFLLDGELVEYGPTASLFSQPKHGETENYLAGAYG